MTELRAAQVVLRPLVDDDVGEVYLSWLRDPEVNRHLESRFADHTLESLREFVDTAHDSPLTHLFAIVLADTNRHIGNIKLQVDAHHERGDIGIMIGARDAWGHGYATAAIALLSAWALQDLGLAKVTAGAYATNVGSIRAFERAGFTVEAVLPEHCVDADGARIDGVLLGRRG